MSANTPHARVPARSWGDRLRELLDRAGTPVDGDSLVPLRVGFGLTMLWATFDRTKYVREDYVLPALNFKYAGFEWVRPLPEAWLLGLYAVLAACGALVAVGLFTRAAALVFGIGFSYVFLLERALYLNHDYLAILLAFTLAVVPSGRTYSLDARLRRDSAPWVPRWSLWLARFHVALPYVFGGFAKWRADWLRGQPMWTWLSEGPLPHLFGSAFTTRWVAVAFSWGGMLFDLAIVPMVLWHRTRTFGLVLAFVFHLSNATMFDIGIFPWLMMFATLVFLPTGTLRRSLGRATPAPGDERPRPRLGIPGFVVLGLYVLMQLVLPFRFLLYPGDPNWTEEGNTFAWQMMLRHKTVALQIVVRDPVSGETTLVDPGRDMTPKQFLEMGKSPELLRQYARYLGRSYRDQGRTVTVHSVVLCSLNGRKPQLLVDPGVDLAACPRTWGHADWIVPLEEPFRREPWNVPVREWAEHVEFPIE